MKQLVFFASGSGTNFQSVIDAVETEIIDAEIVGLITNKKNIKALERAKKHKIPSKIVSPIKFKSQQAYENQLMAALEKWNPTLIILAGYLLKIPDSVIGKYEGKIINIHPALLPKYGGKGFYGKKVHQAVLEGDEIESGCSVHIVTKEYDEGPVLAQRKVPVHPTDTPEKLAGRILKQEHILLPEVIQKLVGDY